MPLPRLTPHTYRAGVYDSLKAAILDGSLEPGSALVERRIAEETGVSRAPVREALRKLEEEGMVITIPYKGSYVTRVSPETMDEVLSLRRVLELFAAERALPRLGEPDLARMRGILADMEEAAASERADRLVELHSTFHGVLYQSAGHALLLQFWDLMDRQVRLYSLVHQRAYESLVDYATAHQSIIEALTSADPARIQAELLHHLSDHTASLVTRHRDGQPD